MTRSTCPCSSRCSRLPAVTGTSSSPTPSRVGGVAREIRLEADDAAVRRHHAPGRIVGLHADDQPAALQDALHAPARRPRRAAAPASSASASSASRAITPVPAVAGRTSASSRSRATPARAARAAGRASAATGEFATSASGTRLSAAAPPDHEAGAGELGARGRRGRRACRAAPPTRSREAAQVADLAATPAPRCARCSLGTAAAGSAPTGSAARSPASCSPASRRSVRRRSSRALDVRQHPEQAEHDVAGAVPRDVPVEIVRIRAEDAGDAPAPSVPRDPAGTRRAPRWQMSKPAATPACPRSASR